MSAPESRPEATPLRFHPRSQDLPSSAGSLPATVGAWTLAAIEQLLDLPFPDLIHRAQQVHREHFDATEVQLSTLMSIKTGGCAEDCAYCSQSSRHDTELKAAKLSSVDEVLSAARNARDSGVSRFCMGAAWRNPSDRHMESLTTMVREVKAMGLETCMTLGMLEDDQAQALADAGLDYYNHNLDTDPDYYGQIVSTRTYDDRLQTLARVRRAGIKICCGGILGLGESRRHRAGLIAQLANLDPYPESVPVNQLVPIEGTPLADVAPLDPIEFLRTVAVARITMPRALVRLSAGREQMPETMQALAFLAGANSIFYGDMLLTVGNARSAADRSLIAKLGMHAGECRPR